MPLHHLLVCRTLGTTALDSVELDSTESWTLLATHWPVRLAVLQSFQSLQAATLPGRQHSAGAMLTYRSTPATADARFACDESAPMNRTVARLS